MQETYPVEVIKNHIIADINGTIALIDTGCPTTFGRVDNIRLMDELIPIKATFMGFGIEVVHRLIGDSVDVLMGNNILSKHPFIIDLSHNSIVFSYEPLALEGFQAKPIMPTNTIGLLIDAILEAETKRFVIDTGAMLSFLARKYTQNLEQIDEIEDYNPILGSFRTPVYIKTINVFGEDLQFKFGNLPIMAENMFTLNNIVGVLGSDLFHLYIVELDYSRHQARYKRI